MGTTASARELALPPNVLSLARIPLAAGFAAAALGGHAVLAVGILGLAAATDVADGWMARRLSQETATGRIVDPLADKLFFVTVAIVLVASGRLTPVQAVLLGTREILQIFLGAALLVRRRLVRVSAATPSVAAGKMTTALQVAAAAAALLWPAARDPLAVATAVCGVVAGAEYWVNVVRAA